MLPAIVPYPKKVNMLDFVQCARGGAGTPVADDRGVHLNGLNAKRTINWERNARNNSVCLLLEPTKCRRGAASR